MTELDSRHAPARGGHETACAHDSEINDGTAALREPPAYVATGMAVYGPTSPAISEVAAKLASQEGLDDPHRRTEILQWCREAAARFESARIQVFIPILVENIVNSRMHHDRYLKPAQGLSLSARIN